MLFLPFALFRKDWPAKPAANRRFIHQTTENKRLFAATRRCWLKVGENHEEILKGGEKDLVFQVIPLEAVDVEEKANNYQNEEIVERDQSILLHFLQTYICFLTL